MLKVKTKHNSNITNIAQVQCSGYHFGLKIVVNSSPLFLNPVTFKAKKKLWA